MKQITIIVPDTVTYTFGGHFVTESKTEITADIILKMLSKRPDYHEEYYYKEPEQVKIRIEECGEECKYGV